MLKFSKLSLTVMLTLFLVIAFSAITAYAADYYVTYDPADATANIGSAVQSAVNNTGGDRVILSYQGPGTKWISGPIQLYDDIEFVLEDGVILEAKSGAFPSTVTPFILINEANNVSVTGTNATIRMLIDEYTNGEWRHCISVRSSSYVDISGVILQKSGGDGIYLGSNQNPNSHIVIENVICDGNARNGISVISADYLTITDCTVRNTGIFNPPGLASGGPYAGIDFEPNDSTEKISNITISDCTFDNNIKFGIFFQLGNLDSTSSAVSASISGCTVNESFNGIKISLINEGVAAEISVENTIVKNTEQCAFFIYSCAHDGVLIDINNCTIESPNDTNNGYGAIYIAASAVFKTGNIIIDNIHIFKSKSPYAVRLAGGTPDCMIEDVTGIIYSDQADAVIFDTSYSQNISLTLHRLNVSFAAAFSSDVDNIGGTDSEPFFTDPSVKLYTGDYNGDGKTDLFVKGYSTYRALYIAKSTGDGFIRKFLGAGDGVGGTDSEAFLTNASAVVYPGDYNGDGKTDLFVKGYGTYRVLYLANSTGDGFDCAFSGDTDGLGGTDSEPFFTDASAMIYLGDYNGDGKTDLFAKGWGTYRALYLANGSGTGFDCAFSGDADGVGGTDSDLFFTDSTAKIFTGDYNGDGKTDLFVKGYGAYRALYTANSEGTGFDCVFLGDTDGLGGTDSEPFFTDASAKIYPGDYNGDGKTDLFIKGYGTYRALYLANSAGDGFSSAFQGSADNLGGTDSESFFTDPAAIVYPGDYNGDGKTDFFIKGFGTYRALYVAKSAGTGFIRTFMGSADDVGGTDSDAFFTNAGAEIYTGDYNGDNKTDLFVKGYGTWRSLYIAGGTYN